jgi:transposase
MRAVGIDLGPKEFATLSKDEMLANGRYGQRAAEKPAKAWRAQALYR